MNRRSTSPLLQAVGDTVVLWVLLLFAAALQLVRMLGMEVPLLARTTFWRLSQPGWAVVGVALAVVGATAILATATADRPERGYFVAGLLAGLAVAFYVMYDPGTGTAFAITAAALYRGLGRAAASRRI